MAKLTELQTLLIGCLKQMNLDEAAILFIILALKSAAAQSAMALYLRDNPKATQFDLMQAAVDFQEIAEELGEI